jgi:hypothetical protein
MIHLRTSRRARRQLLILVATCLAAPLMPLALATPPSAPLVYMTQTRRDFGDVFAGEELEQVFPVRNDGDAALEMEHKPLTGRSAPAPSNRLLRASARQAGLALRPAAAHLAAPS